MLKRITLLLGVLLFGLSTIWLFPAIPYVQNVNVTQIRFYSHSLKKEMNLAVYLPPGYSNNKKYPVLYLLPGYDANENSWMNGYFGFHGINVNALADQIIRSGQIRPSIIVSPQLDNSYGINTSSAWTNGSLFPSIISTDNPRSSLCLLAFKAMI